MNHLLSRSLLVLVLLTASLNAARADEPGHAVGRIILAPQPTDRAVQSVTVAAGQDAALKAPDYPATWASWEYSPDAGTTWLRVENGFFFSDAHATTLRVTHTSRTMDGYLFRVLLDGTGGQFQSDPGRLTVAAQADDAPLANLATRGTVGAADDVLIAGVVIGGAGVKTVLVRGIGPALAKLGLSRALAATTISVYDSSGKLLAANSGWGGTAIFAAAFARVGAFALDSSSADSALILTLPAGSYTVQLAGTLGATGIGMIEIYGL